MIEQAPFPQQALADAAQWGRFFGEEWARDFPTQIHEGQIGDGGTPRWTADFARWLTNAPDEEQRHRVTKAMRRLRRVAPRQYEVAYRVLIVGESFEEVTRWLNERAARNNIPLPVNMNVHYVVKDALALFLCTIEFVRTFY